MMATEFFGLIRLLAELAREPGAGFLVGLLMVFESSFRAKRALAFGTAFRGTVLLLMFQQTPVVKEMSRTKGAFENTITLR
jgi:hypothetical protein